ncbi:MAG: DUF86 domain-containing protein [Lewinellaceae bacterium]|nr:DUF86 domain-containing protein [Lewinellaceae bacterium]
MSVAPTEYLRHMLDECAFIISVITPETTKEQLLENETLKRAVVRSIEIIGEASKKIPADQKLLWSHIEWKNIAGMRDKLIHDYFGVNYSIVWDVARNKIPDLKIQIEVILQSFEKK